MFKQIRLQLLRIFGKKNYEKIIFFLKNYYAPNLNSPSTFNEIISTRKLKQEHDELQIICSDKLKVREYVYQKVGGEYLTELYDLFGNNIRWNPEKWPGHVVLKANHGSGKKFIKIINDTAGLNHEELEKWANRAIQLDYGVLTNENWYNKIEPRVILVEERLNPSGMDLRDYKFLMVNGEVLFIQVDQGRFTNHTRNLYDLAWNPLVFTFAYPAGPLVEKPSNLDLMIELSKNLSSDFDLCRVDLYEDENNRVKFGEITFSPDAGWGKFFPKKYDKISGDLLRKML
jgi:hypothetical protein